MAKQANKKTVKKLTDKEIIRDLKKENKQLAKDVKGFQKVANNLVTQVLDISKEKDGVQDSLERSIALISNVAMLINSSGYAKVVDGQGKSQINFAVNLRSEHMPAKYSPLETFEYIIRIAEATKAQEAEEIEVK